MHPLAIANGGFDLGDGLISHGDKATLVATGEEVTVDEVLHDGEAFITTAAGGYATVKWRELRKLKERRGEM